MVRKVMLTGYDKDGNDSEVPWLFSENGVSVVNTSLGEIIDQNANNYVYFGSADPGVATSASFWQISRVNSEGNPTITDWADGNADFDNVWDDRVSLSYS